MLPHFPSPATPSHSDSDGEGLGGGCLESTAYTKEGLHYMAGSQTQTHKEHTASALRLQPQARENTETRKHTTFSVMELFFFLDITKSLIDFGLK